jgi:tetratricopeptide (TPR) repeat protein
MTAELDNKKKQEAQDALDEIKRFAATKNARDPAQILEVIEKLESQESRIREGGPEMDNEHKKILFTWNDNYLALCRDAWRSAKRTANAALKIQDFDKAVAALDTYPQNLRTTASEYWDDLERYKNAITKLKEAPGKVFETIGAAEAAVAKGDYDTAIGICIRAIERLNEEKDLVALRIVANEHISVIDRWIDEIAKKEGNEAALERLEELCGTVSYKDHDFYIGVKSRELGGK